METKTHYFEDPEFDLSVDSTNIAIIWTIFIWILPGEDIWQEDGFG